MQLGVAVNVLPHTVDPLTVTLPVILALTIVCVTHLLASLYWSVCDAVAFTLYSPTSVGAPLNAVPLQLVPL